MADGLGFEADAKLGDWAVDGYWELMIPLSVSSIGQDPIIDKITVLGQKDPVDAWGWKARSKIALILDEGEAWSRDITHHGENIWSINSWTPGVDIANFQNINLRLYQALGAPIVGWVAWRDGYIAVEGTYLTDDPPQLYNVNVLAMDAETLEPINNTTIRILSGSQIIAQGNTDNRGEITFPDIVEGAYTLKAYKNGYVVQEQRLDVTGITHIEVKLVRTLGPNYEAFLKYALIGAGAYAGYKILTAPQTHQAYSKAREKGEEYYSKARSEYEKRR